MSVHAHVSLPSSLSPFPSPAPAPAPCPSRSDHAHSLPPSHSLSSSLSARAGLRKALRCGVPRSRIDRVATACRQNWSRLLPLAEDSSSHGRYAPFSPLTTWRCVHALVSMFLPLSPPPPPCPSEASDESHPPACLTDTGTAATRPATAAAKSCSVLASARLHTYSERCPRTCCAGELQRTSPIGVITCFPYSCRCNRRARAGGW